MAEMELRKKRQEEYNKKIEQEKQKYLLNEEKKRKEKLQKAKELEETNRTKLLIKFEQQTKHVESKKKAQAKFEIVKREEIKLKQEQRYSIMQRMKKMHEYKRSKYETEMQQKFERIEKLRQDRKVQQKERNRLRIETQMQKKLLSDAMTKLRRSTHLSNISSNELGTLSVLDLFQKAKIDLDPAITSLLKQENSISSNGSQTDRTGTRRKTIKRNNSAVISKKTTLSSKHDTHPSTPIKYKKQMKYSRSARRLSNSSSIINKNSRNDTKTVHFAPKTARCRTARSRNKTKNIITKYKTRPHSARYIVQNTNSIVGYKEIHSLKSIANKKQDETSCSTHKTANQHDVGDSCASNKSRTFQDKMKTLDDLQLSLHRRLIWMIKQEEIKEEERRKLLVSITKQTEKQRLDKIFGFERRHAAMRIQNLKKLSFVFRPRSYLLMMQMLVCE